MNGCVQGLGHQNGSSDAEILLTGDEAGTAEVGRYANALKNRRQGDKGFDVSNGKVVDAGRDGSGTSSLDGGGK